MQDYVEVVTQTEFTPSQIEDIWNGEEPEESLDQTLNPEFKMISGWEFSRDEKYKNKLQHFITPDKQENRVVDQVSENSMASPKEMV